MKKIKARRKEYITKRSNTVIKNGTTFGKLTVIEKRPSSVRLNSDRPLHAIYLAECYCGTREEFTSRFLKTGKHLVCSKCRTELIGKNISEGKRNKALKK